MKKETKNTLISLSLAGAIGYYLYNKLAKAGFGLNFADEGEEPARERTKRELSWRPEQPVFEDEYSKNIEEEVVEDALFNGDVQEEMPSEVEESLEMEDVEKEEEVVSEDIEATEEAMVDDSLFGDTLLDNTTFEEPSLDNIELDMPNLELESELEIGGELEGTELSLEDEIDLDLEEMKVPVDELLEKPIEESPVVEEQEEEELDLSDLGEDTDENEDDEEETDADTLLNGVSDEPKIMENVEPLHKVDQKDTSSKEEFKNIMDFFKTL